MDKKGISSLYRRFCYILFDMDIITKEPILGNSPRLTVDTFGVRLLGAAILFLLSLINLYLLVLFTSVTRVEFYPVGICWCATFLFILIELCLRVSRKENDDLDNKNNQEQILVNVICNILKAMAMLSIFIAFLYIVILVNKFDVGLFMMIFYSAIAVYTGYIFIYNLINIFKKSGFN